MTANDPKRTIDMDGLPSDERPSKRAGRRGLFLAIAYSAPIWAPIIFLPLVSFEKYVTGGDKVGAILLWPSALAAAGAGAYAIASSSAVGILEKLFLVPGYFAFAFVFVCLGGVFFLSFWCGDVLTWFSLRKLCPVGGP